MDPKQKITIREKLNVICEVKAKSMTSQVEIANCLGLTPSSLSRIALNKNKIIEGETECGAHSKKSMNIKLGANKGLEKILLHWFQQVRSETVPVSTPVLCQKATDIALHLKIYNFKTSNGWLHRHLK
jgi:hypothetical protein